MPDPVHATSIFVFAYGSNLDSGRMKGRVPSAEVLGTTRLQCHDLRFHKRGSRDGTGKADAFWTGQESDQVLGVVYRVLAKELPGLDKIEGLGFGYERVSEDFIVETESGILTLQAWFYKATEDAIDPSLRPMAWYRNHVTMGALEHGLDPVYVTKIESVPCVDAEEGGL